MNKGTWVGIAIASLLVIGFILGAFTTRDVYRRMGVQHGIAHWEVNADGETSFIWHSEPERKP